MECPLSWEQNRGIQEIMRILSPISRGLAPGFSPAAVEGELVRIGRVERRPSPGNEPPVRGLRPLTHSALPLRGTTSRWKSPSLTWTIMVASLRTLVRRLDRRTPAFGGN